MKDVWVELENDGVFPAYEEDNRETREAECEGEALDKVLYINPTGAEKILRAASYERDMVTYQYDGKTVDDDSEIPSKGGMGLQVPSFIHKFTIHHLLCR